MPLPDQAFHPGYERRFFIRCIMPGCGGELACPADTEGWGWLNTEPVKQWRAEHVAHGNERTVGPEIRYVEKE